MTIQERIEGSKQRFDQLEQQKQEILVEQQKLMGEYRVLNELLTEQQVPKKVNKKADTVEVIPEEDK